MMLLKLPGLRKLSALKEKKIAMTTSPMSTGQLPRFPARMLSRIRPKKLSGDGLLPAAAAPVLRAHCSGSGAVDGMPETFVGTPAVIAWTTSCCVVVLALVDGDAAAEPQDSDPVCHLEDVVQVVRDEHDREPLIGQPLDELEHLLRLGDAERRSRLVEDHEAGVPHHRAGDGDRLPLAAGERRDRLADRADRGHREGLHRLGRLGLHHRLLEPLEDVVRLAAEVHVLDDVEVVAEREILVDDLDPELRGVLRAVDVNDLAVEDDVAAVRRRGCPATHLISVDLPAPLSPTRAITSPAPDLELDLRERLHRAEALRDPVKLEQRCRCRGGRHGCKGRWGRHEDGPTLVASYVQYFL